MNVCMYCYYDYDYDYDYMISLTIITHQMRDMKSFDLIVFK